MEKAALRRHRRRRRRRWYFICRQQRRPRHLESMKALIKCTSNDIIYPSELVNVLAGITMVRFVRENV